MELAALVASLPAATTTTALLLRAELIADCMVDEQLPPPPSDMLMTRAGYGLLGTPEPLPRPARRGAGALPEAGPPPWPSRGMGTPWAPWPTRATPVLLLVPAATVPATCVPCQLDEAKL